MLCSKVWWFCLDCNRPARVATNIALRDNASKHKHQRINANAQQTPNNNAKTAEVRDLVAVYKNPPYPLFYGVVHHSFALVPMLASPLYYRSKFSSTILTSLITGVPVIADQRLLDAYSMIGRSAVFFQVRREGGWAVGGAPAARACLVPPAAAPGGRDRG